MSIVLQDIFGRQYSLEIPLKIGSDSSNDIVLLDSSISPFHAVVSQEGDGALVVDQESDFGVFVNQKQIRGKATINRGDWFSVGKVLFTLADGQPGKSVLPSEAREDSTLQSLDEEATVKQGILPKGPETAEMVIPGIIPPANTNDATIPIPENGNVEPSQPTETSEPALVPTRESQYESEYEMGPKAIPESEPASTPEPVHGEDKAPVQPPESIQPTELEPTIPQENPEDNPAEPVPQVEMKSPARKPIGLALILGIIGLVVLAASVVGFFLYQSDPDLQAMVTGLTGEVTSNTTGESPEEFNLTDSTLHTIYSTSFIQKQEDIYEGKDDSGAALKIQIVQTRMEQSTPTWSNYLKYLLTRNDAPGKESEYSILNGLVYMRAKGQCSVLADKDAGKHAASNWPQTSLKSYVTGTARKVESGIKVNSVMADKYELKVENSPFSDSLLQMPVGELYRAQNGGYLVKMKIVQQWAAGKWKGAGVYGFAANQPVTVSSTVDFTYYPAGKLNVIVPAVCAGKIQPAN